MKQVIIFLLEYLLNPEKFYLLNDISIELSKENFKFQSEVFEHVSGLQNSDNIKKDGQ